MNTVLETYVDDYLGLRRALGHKLAHHEDLLKNYLVYLETVGDTVITVKTAIVWASLPTQALATWRSRRLMVVAGYAAYVHCRQESLAQLIPAGLIPASYARTAPYIYTPDQTAALMNAASGLRSSLRAATATTVIGLMAVTGMRISECVQTNIADLDVGNNVLTITGKRGKQRFIPVDPSTTMALTHYLRTSRSLGIVTDPQAFFVNASGRRLRAANMQVLFRQLSTGLGYLARPGGQDPRLHDFRHTFATTTLIRAYQDGVDIDAQIAVLATYLGHVSPTSTYWYLQATPELLELAAARVEAAQAEEEGK
jgi:integrase